MRRSSPAAKSTASRRRRAARPGIYGLETKKAEAIHRVAPDLGNRIDYRPRTLVWNLFEDRLDLLRPEGYGEQRFDRLILATGAMDRALPFPGWTLPGVFTLGGAQIALKAQGVAIGRRVAFVGAGPLLPLVAHQYAEAGADVVAVLDVTPFLAKLSQLPGLMTEAATLAKGLWYTARNRLHRLTVQYGVRAIRAEGSGQVEALVYRDKSGARASDRMRCRSRPPSACAARPSSPISPAAASSSIRSVANGCRSGRRRGARRCPAVYLAGDGARIGGADMAELQGRRTALALLEDVGSAGRRRTRRRGSTARSRGRPASARRSRTPTRFPRISSTPSPTARSSAAAKASRRARCGKRRARRTPAR